MLRVHDSALKHGYSTETVSHAFDLAVYEVTIDGESEPPKVLTIGPDDSGNLLELIGGRIAGGDYLVWHADRCRTTYLDLLAGGGGDT